MPLALRFCCGVCSARRAIKNYCAVSKRKATEFFPWNSREQNEEVADPQNQLQFTTSKIIREVLKCKCRSQIDENTIYYLDENFEILLLFQLGLCCFSSREKPWAAVTLESATNEPSPPPPPTPSSSSSPSSPLIIIDMIQIFRSS